MEKDNNEIVLERMSNPNTPATMQDYKEIGACAERMVSQISGVVSNVACSLAQIKALSVQVELETARMECALNALMVKAQKDIHIYEKSLPILDKQFEMCQERMDKLMDKSLDLLTTDISDGSLKRQEAIMSMIELTNNSLNSLISKLIPTY